MTPLPVRVVVVALVVLVVVLVSVHAITKLPELVDMVETPDSQRNFFIVSSFTFPVKQGVTVLPNSTKCKCRQACWVSGERCVSWSLVEEEEEGECRLSSQSLELLTMSLQPHENATFYFWQKSTRGRYWWGKDDLLYMEAHRTMPIEQAIRYCDAFPGHRLVIFKTALQREILHEFDSYLSPRVVLNLHMTANGPPEWGDGTLYKDTVFTDSEIRMNGNLPYFVWYQEKIDDAESLTSRRKIICQINPYHLDW